MKQQLPGYMVLALSAAAWFFSCLLLFLGEPEALGIAFFFLLHIASIVLLFFSFRLRALERHHFWNTNTMWVALMMPIVGFFFYATFRHNIDEQDESTFLQEYRDHISYSIRGENILPDETHRRRILEEKSNLQAFVDILNSRANEEQKIAVIDSLTGIQNQRAIELIRKAQTDESPEVSYVAATAMVKIETPILEEISFWQKKLEKDPDNGEVHSNLGRLYNNYCYLGILDELNRIFYLERALDSFRKAARILRGKSENLLELGKVLTRLDRPAEAIDSFEKYIENKPEDKNGYIWKAEALFRLNRHRELGEFLQQVEHRDLPDWKQFENIRAMWT